MAARTAAREWREGWTLVLAAATGFSFFAIMTTAMGAFIEPLSREFGWSRTLVSAGMPVAGITTVLFSPFVGMAIDRYGSRRLALPGTAAMILSIASFSLLSGSVVQWFALWGVFAVISLAVTVTVWSAAVADSFNAARGLALGLTLAGTAFAQMVTPVLATFLIDNLGWRAAFAWMAFGWGGVALLLCALFFHDRRGAGTRAAKIDTSSLPGLTIREALRSRGLWQIAVSIFVLMVLTIGLLIHQIPILTEVGVSREKAALLAGAGGAAGIVGKMVTGVLIDRYRANWIGGITLGVTALAFGLLLDGFRTPATIVIAMIVNGYSAGTKLQICSYLTSRYAGLRNYGTVFGAMGSLTAFGSALGPLLAARVYDVTGGYTPFLIAGTLGCIVCGVLIVTLPAYPEWKREDSGAMLPA